MSATSFKSFCSSLSLISSHTASKALKYFCWYNSAGVDGWCEGASSSIHRGILRCLGRTGSSVRFCEAATTACKNLQRRYLFAAFARTFLWPVVSLDWRVQEICSVGVKITMQSFCPKNVLKRWSCLTNPPAFIAYSSRPSVWTSSKVDRNISKLLWWHQYVLRGKLGLSVLKSVVCFGENLMSLTISVTICSSRLSWTAVLDREASCRQRFRLWAKQCT